MSHSRSKRLARLAACTALALSAGALLSAGPASAAGKGSDRPAAVAPAVKPTVTRPERDQRAWAQGATAATQQPRLDLDGDGFSDLLFRTGAGYTGAFPTSNPQSPVVDFRIEGDDQETVKDIVALGNAVGNWNPEILTLTFDGKLQLRETSGNWAGAPLWTGTGWQVYNRVFGAGDLNRDGRQDLLARTPSGDLYYYAGTGNVSSPFAGRVKVSSGWEQYDQILGTGDVDGDGAPDVIGRMPTGELFLHRGSGNASSVLQWRTQIASGWTFYTQLVAADDIDGDGKADIMGVTGTGDLFCHFSEGNGRFTWQYECGKGWTSLEMFVGASITPVYGKKSIGGIDANGQAWQHVNKLDGGFHAPFKSGGFVWPDDGSKLVLAAGLDKRNWGHQLQFNQWGLTNRTTGQSLAGDWWGVTSYVVGGGDVSGDGKGDLLTRDIWGNLYVHQGDGTGNKFAAPINVGGGWDQYKFIASGDFNGDGHADVAGVTPNGDAYYHQATGNASAPFKGRWLVTNLFTPNLVSVTSPGDVTGDGKADLILVDADGTVTRKAADNPFGSAVWSGAVGVANGFTYRSIG
ncbi:FG-GAP repeat domain-containing protein [Streptomyces antimicrobicus]|uniref:VCBS repeat-containing protein n=1 Tax=Streptomyces antimicrobicus TaxID=2883108 RepID=A0ABS8B6W0_9ACTN|nr:VCBS repeat-containing protein [Streptomyces antimicrobicus]MCB5180348.1 VCBS repeat-containing protein [Streptomyces antimicrobicus]